MDFGANKTLTGGLALQTLDTWQEFIGTDNVSFGSNSSEVYFEEDNFDKFADHTLTPRMFIQSRNIRGVSVWSEFMTQISIFLRLAKI